jgi:hypothetical protein
MNTNLFKDFYYAKAPIKTGLMLFIIILPFNCNLFAVTGDYLIVENPAALQLLNAYEQQISPEAKETFPAHLPFLIRDDNHLLSDTYTRAVMATYDGSVYYLVKNAEGQLAAETQSGKPVRINNAGILSDTIQVISGILILERSGSRGIQLAANELVQRIFRKNNRYYVKRLTSPVFFGWLNVSQNRHWQEYTSNKRQFSPKEKFPVYLRNAIQAHFENYNTQLQQLFAFFSQQSKTPIPPPSWFLQVAGNQLTCILSNVPAGGDFSQTIDLIIKRIDKILPPGSGKISRTGNRLVITYGKS